MLVAFISSTFATASLTPIPPPVRIGALLPRQLTSGKVTSYGPACLTSVVMAIEEINNKSDGVADDLLPNVQLLLGFRDSKCDANSAILAPLSYSTTHSTVPASTRWLVQDAQVHRFRLRSRPG